MSLQVYLGCIGTPRIIESHYYTHKRGKPLRTTAYSNARYGFYGQMSRYYWFVGVSWVRWKSPSKTFESQNILYVPEMDSI